jgi:hypothetical protein
MVPSVGFEHSEHKVDHYISTGENAGERWNRDQRRKFDGIIIFFGGIFERKETDELSNKEL